MDFFVKKSCGFLAIKLENRLNPGRASFHIFNQVTELFNGISIAVQRAQRTGTFFPQHNARIQIKRAFFQAGIGRIIEHHCQSRIFLHLLRIHNLDGIEQLQAIFHFILGACHLCIGDLFGKRFRSTKHFSQATDRGISRILVRCTARQKLHVHALRLFQLVRIFQIAGVAILQRIDIITIRISVQIHHQRICASHIIH